jgi:hypothetical protein
MRNGESAIKRLQTALQLFPFPTNQVAMLLDAATATTKCESTGGGSTGSRCRRSRCTKCKRCGIYSKFKHNQQTMSNPKPTENERKVKPKPEAAPNVKPVGAGASAVGAAHDGTVAAAGGTADVAPKPTRGVSSALPLTGSQPIQRSHTIPYKSTLHDSVRAWEY